MKPYFQRLLRAGPEQGLGLYGLPFYCIGGAGKHYPRTSGTDDLETPPNLRLPKRILGIAPHDPAGSDAEACEDSLRRIGYGGVWLDSHEVECYPRERGVWPRAHSSVVPVHRVLSASPGGSVGTEPGAPHTPSPLNRIPGPEIATSSAIPDQIPGNSSRRTDPVSTTGLYFDMDRFLECKKASKPRGEPLRITRRC